jgi:hypothetical protein
MMLELIAALLSLTRDVQTHGGALEYTIRLSVRFFGLGPSVDDILQMPELKSTVARSMDSNPEAMTAVVDYSNPKA